MKTKLDMRLEAARLAIESGLDIGFTGLAVEIYNFLVSGIELPDKEIEKDPIDYMEKLSYGLKSFRPDTCNLKTESDEAHIHKESVAD